MAVPGDTRGFHTLRLTGEGRKVLRGEVTPSLSQAAQRDTAVTAAAIVDSWEGVDRGLFEALRGLRRNLAQAAAVPAYIVFSDATLRDLARRRPTNASLLHDVHGIGQQKAATYGGPVVEVISDYCRHHQLEANLPAINRADRNQTGGSPSRSALVAFDLFDQGSSVADVCQRMNRAASTVYDYLIEYIAARRITDPARWVEPSLAETIEIVASYNDTGRLRPTYEALHGRVGYDAIKIVMACQSNRLARCSHTRRSGNRPVPL